jgi:hypothetical protein
VLVHLRRRADRRPAGDRERRLHEQDRGGGSQRPRNAASSEIAAPINGIGIAGVAPEATIVALKACTIAGFCFADSVAAALRNAGDQELDVVNLSLFADPFLYYCKSDTKQRSILRENETAARYAQLRGVMIVASAGNEQADLHHPMIDDVSPDWPPDSAVEREVKNNCRVAPAERPQTLTVSATPQPRPPPLPRGQGPPRRSARHPHRCAQARAPRLPHPQRLEQAA